MTLLLDRGYDKQKAPINVEGTSFYKEGKTGVADSIHAVQNAGFRQAPTYLLVQGRSLADSNNPIWTQWHDSYAERLTLTDAKGTLGEEGAVYVVDIQNGGLFAGNPQRIRSAVLEGGLTSNYAMSIEQSEVDELLDAIARQDEAHLKQKGWTTANVVKFFTDFGSFREASNDTSFLNNNPAYVVVRKVADAQANKSGYEGVESQLHNPDLVIPSGGVAPLGAMLDKAQSFGWDNFGSHHDGYTGENSGRLVILYNDYNGVSADSDMSNYGRSVGVAPEALEARAKIVIRENPNAPVAPAQQEETVVQPNLEEVIAFSRRFVPPIAQEQYEDGLKKFWNQ